MKYSRIAAIVLSGLSVSCASSVTRQAVEMDDNIMFVEQAQETFHKDVKNRKGWDAPTIADLDQDGFPDVIINDHGYGLRVMWNNNGKLAFPYDVLMGDLHGVSVGDLNFDGQLDVIISRGGGSGSNARNSKIYTVSKDREFKPWPESDEPLPLMRGRTVKFVDLDNDGDLDLLNFAFPSSEKKAKNRSENYVHENDGAGNLAVKSQLPILNADGQKTLVTDINNDGVPDLFIYGHGNIKVFKGDGQLGFSDVSKQVLPANISNVTGVAEIDFDNDGDFDIVLSRGLPFEKGETFFDEQTKRLGFYTKRGSFNFDNLKIGDTFLIENYQAPWPEMIPYIGESGYKLSYPGETQSGRTINLISSNALGFPDDLTDKKGTFIGFIGNQSWRVAGNMFSPFSGVIHSVENYPAYTHKEGLSDVLLENIDGKFTDISEKSGLSAKSHSTGVIVADVDNDSDQDLVIIRRGNLISENKALLYLNELDDNGQHVFKNKLKHSIISKELGASGMGGEVLDYDLDGDLDIVTGNEHGQWHLFKNTTDDTKNYIKVKLLINHQNLSSLGALVSVKACDVSQLKRVGATGAMYSSSFDNVIHFGLGQCGQSPSIEVTWTNGQSQLLKSQPINSIVVIEN